MDYLNHTCGVAIREASDLGISPRAVARPKCDFRTRPSFVEFSGFISGCNGKSRTSTEIAFWAAWEREGEIHRSDASRMATPQVWFR